MTIRMTMEELLALPPSFGVVDAGRALDIGRTKAYEMARAGEFPCRVIPVGSRYKVTKADLFAELGLNMDGTPATATDHGTAA